MRRRPAQTGFFSQISELERRLMLSAVTWTGNKGDLQWTSPQNWSTNSVPDSSSDVVINVTQGTIISGPSSPTTIHSLTITSGILRLGNVAFEVTNGVSISSGQSLITNGSTFTSDSTITGAGTLDLTNTAANLGNFTVGGSVPNLVLANTTLSGSGTLTIAPGATLSTDRSIFNVPVVNNGTVKAETEDFTATTFNTFSNNVGASFQIVVNESGHGSFVTVTNGFTNLGTISIESGTSGSGGTLNVTKGTLLNAAGGVITFASATGAPSTILANLTNQGTISVPSGQTYRVSTSNSFKNTATLTGPGTMDFTSCPTIDLGTFNISSSVPKFVLGNTTLNGTGVITVLPGVTVSTNHSLFNAPLTVKGTLKVITEDFTNSTFNGALSVVAGGTLNILVNGSGHGSTVVVANGFTNAGTISLESGSDNSGSALNVTQGTLVNAATGVITFAGVTGAPSTINANMSNQGTINIPNGQIYRVTTSFVFGNTATISGVGTIDFTSCPTVDLGAFTFVNGGPNFVLTNTTLKGASTLTVAVGDTLTTNHSTFNAPLTVNGTLKVITEDFTNSNFNGALAIAAGANFNILANSSGHGSTVGVANGFTNLGTISLQSGSNNTSSALNVTTGTLTNAAAAIITFVGSSGSPSTIGADLLNQGTINVPDGQTYRVSGSNLWTNRAALTGTGTIDFTNCGKIDLGMLTITATTPDLHLQNSTTIGTSTVTVNTGAALTLDHSLFNTPIYNKGTLNVVTQDFTNSSMSGPVVNLAGGQMNLLVNGGGHGSAVTIGNSFTNSGILSLQAGNTGNGSSLTVSQGTVLNSATGVINSTGPAGITNSFNGNLNNLGTINIDAPLNYVGLFANTGHVNVSATQEPKILAATIQKPASLYPDLGFVSFDGTGIAALPQNLEVRSFDMGATGAGFTNNSVFTNLTLGNNTYVKLIDTVADDARSSGAEAVYANSLTVPAGTTLDLNQLHVYATTLNIQGSVLNGTVTQVVFNHAPVGAAKTVTTLEDKAYVFLTSDFGFTDPKDSPADALFGVKITSLPVLGTVTDNGVAVATGAVVPVADITGGKLKYTPGANGAGTGYSSFTFQVKDDGGTASGGADTDPISRKLTINVTPVNDAPVGTTKTVTSLEDAAYVVKTADFGFTDALDSPANSLLAVKITLLPGIGTLTNNGVLVTTGQVISATDIAANKLVFQPNANLSGGPFFLMKFQVQDNGGTANGGVDLDTVARVMNIQLTAVNDAPSGASKTISMAKSTSYVFQVADFGFTDSNDSPPNSLLAVVITTLPGQGSLTDNGVAVTAGARISVADITSGKLQFTPIANATGNPYASFGFKVQDNGGTANGGIDTDVTAKTMTIAVS